jgi:hypothetical protein
VIQSADLTGLSGSTTYYWQVRALDAAGATNANGGVWWSFKTMPFPGAFVKKSPSNAAINRPTSLSLTWGISSNADGYEYCVDTVKNSHCDASWVSTGTNTFVDLGGFSNGTTYYWQVHASNSASTTDANGGVWWSFTIIPPLPGAFGKIAPDKLAANQPTTLTLSWRSSSFVASYEYCLDTINNDTCDTSWTSTGTNTYVNLSGLLNGTTYYWQVRAINAAGRTSANGGTWWSFTTMPLPGAFGKNTPSDEAVNRPIALTLTWSDSSHAASYKYCIDRINNTACDSSWISTGTNTSVDLSGLLNGTTYYWQVRAFNTAGATSADGGTWWSFTTRLTQPGAFGKVAPVNGATSQPNTLTLTWGIYTSATSYEYCLDTINNAACDASWVSRGTNTFVNLTGLLNGATYYWQVRALDAVTTTYADGGTWWSFTTLPPWPGAFGKLTPVNGATGRPTSLTLTWGASSDAASYQYCIDTSNNAACNASWVSSGTNTFVNLSGLLNNTIYYWQVRSTNLLGTAYADGGTWWSFTTIP